VAKHILDPMTSSATLHKRAVRRRKKRKSGLKKRPVIAFPEPLFDSWDEPSSFQAALDLHMRRHKDSSQGLARALKKGREELHAKTFSNWRAGRKAPRTLQSLAILGRIERRYRLPSGYFKSKLPHPARAATGHALADVNLAEQRRLSWHLPDDFDTRTSIEQTEILNWVRNVVLSGATDYRRFHARIVKQRFAVRFGMSHVTRQEPEEPLEAGASEDAVESRVIDAPPALAEEMASLVRFKSSTLCDAGYQRNGVWNEQTVAQKVEHLGLLFGAMAASPRSAVRGLGVDQCKLAFGLLVFPAIWDWYLTWRERRRGFYTVWELDMLRVALALTRKDTGWLSQNAHLSRRLTPIARVVSSNDITCAQQDWARACETFQKHAVNRLKEIERVVRVHRDPFEPILPILEADSPLREYRKIADEILRLMPDEKLYPVSAAEAVRSYLLLRLGMHLGLRQRNLRQLLVCPRGQTPKTEHVLIDLRRGELRWSEREGGWEVFIPAAAFKNADSSYFGNKPYRLRLPDLGALYPLIEAWLARHRPGLLRKAKDPGTFFVKTVKVNSTSADYDQNAFYEAWRLTIQRYGIYNPWTGRGVIKGLLPHGPHSVRDVLATHILKKTGSFEQASYAIQDTPAMVAQHYGRFLPQDKAALAARILDREWESDPLEA
jgi:hypothetical protein